MTFAKRNFLTTATLIGAALAVLGGHLVRDGVEFGSSAKSVWVRNQSLVASADRTDEIPAMEYFSQMADMLGNEYVDPVNDQKKLLAGSLRGMLSGLRETHSFFLPEDQWKVFSGSREGHYQGIGADFVMDPSARSRNGTEQDWTVLMPKLIVASVVPGGPADRAGMRSGDSIEFVDNHWVANGQIVADFLKLDAQVKKGLAKPEALEKLRVEYRKKAEKATSPARAVEKLTVGTEGSVSVSWIREGKQFDGTLERRATELPAVSSEDGRVALHLRRGADAELQKIIGDTDRPLVLDLRNNVYCDPQTMEKVLALLVPNGTYGMLVKDESSRPEHGKDKPAEESAKSSVVSSRPLKVEGGASRLRDLTVIVDASTWDAAQVLALALKAAGAHIEDGGMKPDPYLVQQTKVAGIGGYTLTTERYAGTQEATK